jgi:hypothetical protein
MADYEFYCNAATGSNLNAGSTEGAATHTYASGTWVQATGVFSVASGNPVSDGVTVGTWASVYADGSTETGFVGKITARDATTITVDVASEFLGAAPANGTNNRTLKIGGVWKGPSGAEVVPLSFYNAATNDADKSVRVNFKNNASYLPTASYELVFSDVMLQGYSTVAGDGGRATIDFGVSGEGFSVVSALAVRDFIFSSDGGVPLAAVPVDADQHFIVERCKFQDSLIGLHINGTDNGLAEAIQCEATGCGHGFVVQAGARLSYCTSTVNGVGVGFTGDGRADHCVIANNDSGVECTNLMAGTLDNCDVFNNDGDGVAIFAD